MRLLISLIVSISLLTTSTLFASVLVDYDFISEDIVLTWPANNKNYIITVETLNYENCIETTEEPLDANHLHDLAEVRAYLPLGQHRIKIYNSVDGVKDTIFFEKSINIKVTGKNGDLSWCNEKGDYIRVYTKYSPEEEYVEYFYAGEEDVFNDMEDTYFQKKYRVIVAVKDNLESGYSNELITYTALPPKPKNLRLDI